MQDIHELKPLLGVPFPWLAVSMLGLLVLVLGGLAFWVWRRWRQKKQGQPTRPAPSKPKLSPRERGLKALKLLQPERQSPGEFYLQLERILRGFLEELHEQPVTGYTSQEVVQLLQQSPQQPLQEFGLDRLLLRGQQAKFAASSIAPAERQQDLQNAVAFVSRYTAG
ncbi:MAG: DUF4381 family protein [Candidatus Sericytochromatia bacterium]